MISTQQSPALDTQANNPAGGTARSIKVLMYHRIVDDAEVCRNNWTCVHLSVFRKQMLLLHERGFNTVTFDQYRMHRTGKRPLPKHPIIITFDDGYLDTYELAFPVMKKLGMKSVVFVLGDRSIRFNDWDLPLGLPKAELMNAGQIVEMYADGHEIGAHSTTHAKLTRVPEDKAWEEISRSKALLETFLGTTIHSFCYPYGMVNERVKTMVQKAGFDLACSVGSGPAAFGSDLFETRRMTIYNTTSPTTFSLRVRTPSGYYDWTRWKMSQAVRHFREIRGNNVLPPSPISQNLIRPE